MIAKNILLSSSYSACHFIGKIYSYKTLLSGTNAHKNTNQVYERGIVTSLVLNED